MISHDTLTAALCSQIFERTGIRAYDRRIRVSERPVYLVSVAESESELFDGGRQLLRHVEPEVLCAEQRIRGEDTSGLTERLYAAVLPGFRAAGRTFSPQHLRCEWEDGQPVVRWTLEFCDLPGTPDGASPPAMSELRLQIGEDG